MTDNTVNETQMNTDAYDGASSGDSNGTYELTIGLFKNANTLTFTKEEWEAFKYFGDSLLDY